jgi:glycosyltransferase involved in cell wall biosynthesis
MVTIGIDGRALTSDNPAGVASFLIAALKNLPEYMPDIRFVIFSHKPLSKEAQQRLKFFKNVEYIYEQTTLFPGVGVVWFQFKLPLLLKKYNIDYFWGAGQVIPFFIPRKIKKIITVYDIVFLKYRNTMSLPTLLESMIWTRRSIEKSDIIWAISNYTKNELENAFPVRKCKNIFTGLSIDQDLYKKIKITKKEKNELLIKYKIKYPFILFVGTLEPRKNLQFLLSLMPDLAMKGTSLLVIGGKGWKQAEIISRIINQPGYPRDNVVFAGYVPFRDLIKLYNISDLLVSASLNEGYGLPLKEAMACGCPVICPDNSAMKEVVNDSEMRIAGWDRQKWINAITKQIFSANRLNYGLPQSDEWKKIASVLKKRLCKY